MHGRTAPLRGAGGSDSRHSCRKEDMRRKLSTATWTKLFRDRSSSLSAHMPHKIFGQRWICHGAKFMPRRLARLAFLHSLCRFEIVRDSIHESPALVGPNTWITPPRERSRGDSAPARISCAPRAAAGRGSSAHGRDGSWSTSSSPSPFGPRCDIVLNPQSTVQKLELFRIPGTAHVVYLNSFVPSRIHHVWSVFARGAAVFVPDQRRRGIFRQHADSICRPRQHHRSAKSGL